MDLRELRGLEIAARSKLARDGDVWLVPSQTGSATYRVNIWANPSCTCPDFELTQKPCKHVIAARIANEREGGRKAEVIADSVPKRPTYKQNWPLYDKAQMTEKRRFQELLHDLCRNLQDRPQEGPGQRKAKTGDMVFACCLKVYTTFSARRFACDLADAHEKRYTSKKLHPCSINAFLQDPFLTPVLKRLIVQTSLPLAAIETTFAPDSTGFSVSRFVRWFDEKYGCERSGRDWVKCHIMTGTRTNIITACEILDRDANDCPQFKPMLETTAANFKIGDVVADKAYLSRENLELVANAGGTPFIPFKSNSIAGEAGTLWERMYLYYQFQREAFLKHYHQRSNVESTMNMVKAKFRDHVRGKVPVSMTNEVLCKLLCHNIVVVHQSQVELGIEPVFFPTDTAPAEAGAVLRLA